MPDADIDKNFTRIAEDSSMLLRFGSAQRPGTSKAITASTGILAFEKIKHLLSDKPLRRPNRAKPID